MLGARAVMRTCARPALNSNPCGNSLTADTLPNSTQPSLASKRCAQKSAHSTTVLFRIFMVCDFLRAPPSSVRFVVVVGMHSPPKEGAEVRRKTVIHLSLQFQGGLKFHRLTALGRAIDRLNDGDVAQALFSRSQRLFILHDAIGLVVHL